MAGAVTVMMNGLPGAMGHEVAAACIRRGFTLAPTAMTGPGMPADCEVKEGDVSVKVRLFGSDDPAAQRQMLASAVETYGSSLVVIDFTHPTAVNPNSEIYAATGAAFVMGTTGGDREKLLATTEAAGIYAIIAPNMGKQIVALQATMERMAADFPGAFSGYTMEVQESHQKTKADTSGTAKDMVRSFNALGLDFSVEQIQKIREEEAQKQFGVPEEYLDGHAFHTYTLKSGDGSVEFQFKHNVCGRLTYAEGVADAVAFLSAKKREGTEKKVFNMIDVLSAGVMK